MKKMFILGAKDPEMKEIASMCDAMDVDYIYASCNGSLVNPTNAYQSDDKLDGFEEVVYVECNNPTFTGKFVTIDHHNKGDYGYDLNFNDFFEAASIGQVFKMFLKNQFQKTVEVFQLETTNRVNKTEDFTFNGLNWSLSVNGVTAIIPERIVVVAAIDHCLADAYKGYCAGVTKENLLDLRVASLAENMKITFDEVLDILNTFKKSFVNNPFVNGIIDMTSLELGIGYTADYLILREAAIIHNTPIAIKTFNDSKCPGKLMFLSLESNKVEDILSTKNFNGMELDGVFGVPSRGYAGGFISSAD